MDSVSLKKLLNQVKSGNLSVVKAIDSLKKLPFSDIGFAKVDNHRLLRKGFPEVIFCQGKTPSQVAIIMEEVLKHSPCVMASRATIEYYDAVSESIKDSKYQELARTITVDRRKAFKKKGLVAICCAGTADLPVAEEARITAEFMGARTKKIYDAGVAGIHRLLSETDIINKAKCIVAVAGMEGALPSVVGGIASVPIIAVPTSVGYGASFNGIAPLLTMLNSCVPGVVVVNIDNGFGAGYTAAIINNASK